MVGTPAYGSGMRNSRTTRETLLSAAAAEIIQHGYSGASMSSIAARLGMTKGAFAYHFPAKRDLAMAMAQRLLATVEQSHARTCEAVPEGGLRALVAYILDVGQQCTLPENAAGVVLAIDAQLAALDLPRALPVFERNLALRIEEAAAHGELRDPTVDTALATRYTALHVVGSFVYLRLDPASQNSDLHMMRMCITALGAKDPEAVIKDVLAAQREGIVSPTPLFNVDA